MCGIFGVCNAPDAAKQCRLGLYQLGHRGQSSVGIASSLERFLFLERCLGTVRDLSSEMIRHLPGNIAISHSRYATTGDVQLKNAQPNKAEKLSLILAANGDLVPTCYSWLRLLLAKEGIILQGENDGEMMANYLALLILRHQQNLLAAVTEFMQTIVGAYSAIAIYDGKMLAFRDPLGFRPMVMGRNENTWYVASETCALDIVLAHSQNREIYPGELVIFEPNKPPQTYQLIKKDRLARCLFELIYFSRPDSNFDKISVSEFREITGRLLARRQPVEADIVIAVPDSSLSAALGYAQESGISYAHGLTRNHDVGRTFIESEQSQRDASVREKLNPDRRVLAGKRTVVVDDSIVRGTTSRKIVAMIRTPKEGGVGAKEVHLRIASPTIIQCCFYGQDTKTLEELIATRMSVEEIRSYVTADSLCFATIADMDAGIVACGANPQDFCKACFGEPYRTPL